MTTLSLIIIAVIVIAAFCGICRVGAMEDRRRQADRRVAASKRQEEAERRGLAELVEWDDGLDVGKLDVKYEPLKGEHQ